MGGKKKTKWRKLPLEEFTQEIPIETEKVSPTDSCPTDLTREENNCVSSYSEVPEVIQNYVDPQENVDALWYSTSCIVYNPALYSNYMMPVDTSYYYYTMPETGQMQEYMPVPYQEYTPTLPKDTVYLLFPAQALRPTQQVPNITPEWQSRRRRRRYEGYAEYAAIPDRSSALKTEVKDCNNGSGQHVNSRRNSGQSNNFKRMTSFTETSEFDDFASEPSQVCSKPSDTRKDSMICANTHSRTGPNYSKTEMGWLNTENSLSSKKNPEICGIHSKNKSTTKEQTVSENDNSSTVCNEFSTSTDSDRSKLDKTACNELRGGISILPDSNNSRNPVSNSLDVQTIQNKNKEREQSKITDNTEIPINEVSSHSASLDFNEDAVKDTTTNSSKLKSDILQQTHAMNKNRTADIPKVDSQSSLPDILSTLNKTQHGKLQDTTDNCSEGHLSDNVDLDKARSLKSKSLLSQTNYLPSFLSSEALHNEVEMELKQLQSLHSLQANQSIYKLAYDENVTDQSEADSRSPSPVNPESQVPSSLSRNEILIHEADSDSDAGSEDVELLPHRYESETFLNENKHLYVNRLSLAVELLRTRESLPYDDEFKRVVGENNMLPSVHTSGKLNLGFVDDLKPPNSVNATKTFENENKLTLTNPNMNEVISQHQLNHSADSSNDSAIFSDIEFSNLEDELCEPGKEVVAQQNENQDDTEEIRSRYRRLGIQARHYFSPRAGLPLNPCFCCIVM